MQQHPIGITHEPVFRAISPCLEQAPNWFQVRQHKDRLENSKTMAESGRTVTHA